MTIRSISYVLGEGEINSLHFGDILTGSPFWWRAHLREALKIKE